MKQSRAGDTEKLKPDTGKAAQLAEPDSATLLSAISHESNEWADVATNGLQWLKNVRDGISTIDDAVADMERGIKHCRQVVANR